MMDSSIGNHITLDHRRYSNFSGNNYLGLASHPEIIEKIISLLPQYGINFSASRLTTGTSEIHLQLETLISNFKESEDSLVFASGYFGNSILLHALKERYSSIFIDSQAHPSILDGIPKDVRNINFYDHLDANHLESLLDQSQEDQPLIITDGIFALTGEIAPLNQIHPLAKKYGAILIVDDAHATGVLGENGRGTPEDFDIQGKPNIYQSETMSKAFGSYGGFISSDQEIINKIRATSRFYAASTALAPPMVLAGIFSFNYLRQHPELRLNLLENVNLLKAGVSNLGFKTTQYPTPITPLFFEKKQKADQLSKYLKKNGFIAPVVAYPVEIKKSILRMTASSDHTKDQIEELLQVLKKWTNDYGDPY